MECGQPFSPKRLINSSHRASLISQFLKPVGPGRRSPKESFEEVSRIVTFYISSTSMGTATLSL